MGLKKHGITSETIKNMILGAGVIYKNLKYEKPSNGWTGTPLGATSGGLKFNYEAQWLDVEVDGATVLIKGVSKQKVGESATLEGQMTELTEDILVSALHLVKSTSEDTTYVKYVSKENITEADYLENVAIDIFFFANLLDDLGIAEQNRLYQTFLISCIDGCQRVGVLTVSDCKALLTFFSCLFDNFTQMLHGLCVLI